MPYKTVKTVLLVEDSEDDAYMVDLEFKKTSALRLRWVRDGQEARDYIEGKPPYNDRYEYPMPELILLDIKMPRMSGLEFLSWLRNKSPSKARVAPVIMMSGSSLDADVSGAYALGANIYMTKPVDWHKFQEQMRLLGVLWSEHAETPVVV